MRTYNIRRWCPETESVSIATMSALDIVQAPFGLNMQDVGLALLNEMRINSDLDPLPKDMIAGVESDNNVN